jgi:hypothetical protein
MLSGFPEGTQKGIHEGPHEGIHEGFQPIRTDSSYGAYPQAIGYILQLLGTSSSYWAHLLAIRHNSNYSA